MVITKLQCYVVFMLTSLIYVLSFPIDKSFSVRLLLLLKVLLINMTQ